jgi:hypothetical protein
MSPKNSDKNVANVEQSVELTLEQKLAQAEAKLAEAEAGRLAAEKLAAEAEAKLAAKKAQAKKFTRISAFLRALQDADKPLTLPELVKAAGEIGVKGGLAANEKEDTWTVRYGLRFYCEAGYVVELDAKFRLASALLKAETVLEAAAAQA